MSRFLRFNLPGYCYFVTIAVKDKKRVLLKKGISSTIIDDLKFYRNKYNFKLYGYVIMPNHLHLLLSISGQRDLPKIMHDFKSHTSQVINRALKREGSFWQRSYYEHAIRKKDDFQKRLDYIHKNPLSSGVVDGLEDFRFSSYINYYKNDDSLIEVDRAVF